MWPAGAGAEASASVGGRSRKAGTEVGESQHHAVLGRLGRIDLGGNSYDDAAFAARCRIVHTDQRSGQAEAFREIGTKLLSRFGRTQQGMVVTSSSRQSGKTTCASNIALVLAQTGRKVLLVDANEENPALHRVFAGSSGKPGLNEVMFDLAALDEAVQATNVPALSVMHATTNAGSDEEYDAITVERLYHELRQRFDWVIFDSGIMSQKLTKLLLQAVGKALSVANGTSSEDELAMAAQIELCGAVNLGFVENYYTADRKALQQA
jgi:Mrp family chromosome partitioning ATPase